MPLTETKLTSTHTFIHRLTEVDRFIAPSYSIADGGILVDRVVYDFDPDGEDGVPYENLSFKGHQVTKEGNPRKGGGDYFYAHVGDSKRTVWLATMRKAAREQLSGSLRAITDVIGAEAPLLVANADGSVFLGDEQIR